MKTLSIITICLNDRKGLEATIKSVAGQTFSDFEFIVIDGHSTDGSVDVIKANEKIISSWVSEPDRGIYHAMNKGLERASGTFCLFLNAGDFLHDKDVLMKVFKKVPAEEIVYGDMVIDDGSGTLTYGHQPDSISFEYMVYTTLWHPVTFIRKTLFDKVGNYNESLKIVSDFEFFIKAILVNGATTKHLHFPISVFNTKGIGSDAGRINLHQSERKFVLEKYFSSQEIESARQYNILKHSHISIFADRIRKYPLMLKLVSSVYAGAKKMVKR